MSDRAFEYLIQLLRPALGERTGTMPTLTADEWREVYRLSVKHAVVALAWDGVEHMQAVEPTVLDNMPPDLMGKWFADVQTIVTANRHMAQLAANVQNMLSAGGCVSCLLKGASLAQYYPNPEHRQSADIDLWVLPQNGQSIHAHRRSLLAYLRMQPDVVIGEIVYHHIETTIGGTEVELHVTPTWLCNPIYNNRLQRLFAHSRELTPELQELYTLLHAFRHIWHDGLALRHLADYYLVCRHNRQAGIAAPGRLYARLGLATFARALDELTDLLFAGNSAIADTNDLLPRAQHILLTLQERRISSAVQRDYPREYLFNLPWRSAHYLWRKRNNYL